jgi:hypothetical protein
MRYCESQGDFGVDIAAEPDVAVGADIVDADHVAIDVDNDLGMHDSYYEPVACIDIVVDVAEAGVDSEDRCVDGILVEPMHDTVVVVVAAAASVHNHAQNDIVAYYC